MRLRSSLLCILLVAIPMTGCPEKKDKDDAKAEDKKKDDKKDKKSSDAKSSDAKSAAAPADGAKSGEPKKDDALPTSTASAPPADPTAAPSPAPTAPAGSPTDAAPATPGGKSAVPTMEEWTAQTKEVTVLGSSKLNCETKQVREWIRVSCRGKNDTGGEPTGVRVTKGGGRGEDFVFSNAGVASLVYRFVEGVSMEAEFTWSDKSKTLLIAWPRGAPEPPAKAIFK